MQGSYTKLMKMELRRPLCSSLLTSIKKHTSFRVRCSSHGFQINKEQFQSIKESSVSALWRVTPPVSLLRAVSSLSFLSCFLFISFVHASHANTSHPVLEGPHNHTTVSEEDSIAARVYSEASPSVVHITNIVKLESNEVVESGTVFSQGAGCGFIWDTHGHVITNYHVVKEATEIMVLVPAVNASFSAVLEGADKDRDVAVLMLICPERVKSSLKPVKVGDSKALFVGQHTYAIGSPFGLQRSFAKGMINGLGRDPDSGPFCVREGIQSDAIYGPGTSGGVLLDNQGGVVGVITFTVASKGGGDCVGFSLSIPMHVVTEVANDLIKFGKVSKPLIGIVAASPSLAKLLNVPNGVLVMEIEPGSPAEYCELVPSTMNYETGLYNLGDIIVSVDKQPVEDFSDLCRILESKKVGDVVAIEYIRDCERQMSYLILQERP